MLTQTARFKPRGLMGLAYWYAVMPLHGLVFDSMLRGIRHAAERIPGAHDVQQPNQPVRTRGIPNPNPSTKDG